MHVVYVLWQLCTMSHNFYSLRTQTLMSKPLFKLNSLSFANLVLAQKLFQHWLYFYIQAKSTWNTLYVSSHHWMLKILKINNLETCSYSS